MSESYKEFPTLNMLLRHGGVPGINYAYVLGQNISKAEEEGWSMIARLGSFIVEGPKGQATLILMGKGTKIPGGDPNNGRCQLAIDEEAFVSTGLKPSYWEEKLPTEPKPVKQPASV